MTLKSRMSLVLLIALLVAGPCASSSRAADTLSPEVRRLQTKWETIKFGVPEGDEQTKQMNALGEEADGVAAHFPSMLEALIWDGIITSERASMASTFYALGLAKRARDILEQAYNLERSGCCGILRACKRCVSFKRGVSLLMAPESSRCLHLLKSLDDKTLMGASLFPRSIALGHARFVTPPSPESRAATLGLERNRACHAEISCAGTKRPVNERLFRWGNAQEPPPAYG